MVSNYSGLWGLFNVLKEKRGYCSAKAGLYRFLIYLQIERVCANMGLSMNFGY